MTCVASLDEISKRYKAVSAVDGLSLSVDSGEVVALLGPNGAGKTTAISILLGLVDADAGTASLLGGPPQQAIAEGRVGAMLQDGGLMGGVRVAELLAMLRSLYPAPMSVERAVALAQLDGLEQRRTDRLSGGQAQRLRVACALIGNPDLLVLDEPTAAMDVEARRSFWTTMRDTAASGRTIVFSTHYLEEADVFADRIVVIGRGRLLADGTPADIKSTVATRVVRCNINRPDEARLARLPAVASLSVCNGRVELHTINSDATLRALLTDWPDAYAVEVAGADLEEAFMALTAAAA
jgi:ABC-2 type transport system ATP-binding protein